MGGVVVGICAMVWNLSAEREFRNEMPRVRRSEGFPFPPTRESVTDQMCVCVMSLQPDRFFPSRYWSRQIIEHEKAEQAKAAGESS
jgi:hypothetical protein